MQYTVMGRFVCEDIARYLKGMDDYLTRPPLIGYLMLINPVGDTAIRN